MSGGFQAAALDGAPAGGLKRENSEKQVKKRKRESRGGNAVKSEGSTTTTVVPLSGAERRAVDELEQQLVPSVQECSQLVSVIRMLDKHGVASEPLPDEAGVSSLLQALDPKAPHAIPLLEFYLDLAVSAVKTRLAKTQTTLEASSNGMDVAQASSSSSSAPMKPSKMPYESDLEQFHAAIRGLLTELKETAARRLSKKRAKHQDKAKYALHRSMGSFDLFTSTTETAPDAEDKTWQELKDTDVLTVYPTALATVSSASAPTFGDLAPPQHHKRLQNYQPQVEPVTFLYYDAYQSFAPTYDSSTATLSYAQSVALRNGRDSAREWMNKPLPSLPPEQAAGPVRRPIEAAMADIDPSLLATTNGSNDANALPALDEEDLRRYLRILEETQVIDHRLQENSDLLRVLQEAQWARLRTSSTSSSRHSSTADPSDTELRSAKRLLESLVSLANARPRTPDLSRTEDAPWSSSHAQLGARLIKQSIVQRKQQAYYGTLQASNAKAIPDYVMAKDPNAKAESLAPPEMSRKGSSSGGGSKKMKKGRPPKNSQQPEQQGLLDATMAGTEANVVKQEGTPMAL